MTTHRRYSRRTKAAAVVAAAVTSVAAVADETGIPRQTVAYWFDAPEFSELRQKTREDLAAESMGLAHQVMGEITRRINEFEPRDLSVLFGILVDKGQLLAGQATSRTETRELSMDDHERAQLHELLREAVDDAVRT
jgi:hypothetical protein